MTRRGRPASRGARGGARGAVRGMGQGGAAAASPGRRLGRVLSRWLGPGLFVAAVGFGIWGVAVRPWLAPSPDASRIGGPFTLTDQDGHPVTERDFAGKTLMVMFGYTNCPDVCAIGLTDMSLILDHLGPAADRVQGLFITVDPERDTVPVLKAYMANFSPGITGLTGTRAQVAAAAAQWRVAIARVPSVAGAAPGSYAIEHNAAIFIMDPQGRLRGAIDPNEPEVTAESKVRLALGLDAKTAR